MRVLIASAAAAVSLAVASSIALAQANQPDGGQASTFSLAPAPHKPLALSTGGGNDWRFDFNSWAWLLGVEGDVGARGLETDVSADFGDILDASDSILAFSGRLEVGKGPWAVFIDGLYADLGADDQSGPLGVADVDVTFEQILIDFGLMYRIGDWEPTGDAARNRRNITLDVYGGGRYSRLELELDPAILPSQSQDKDWLDPIVGAKLVYPFTRRWHVMANGDIGGFGVESDLTWSATAVLGYDFTIFKHDATVFAGYRAVAWDFSEGSGTSEFVWDVVMHGPIFGFSFKL